MHAEIAIIPISLVKNLNILINNASTFLNIINKYRDIVMQMLTPLCHTSPYVSLPTPRCPLVLGGLSVLGSAGPKSDSSVVCGT